MSDKPTHSDLVEAGARWLRRRCAVVAEELRCIYSTEHPDVIGWSALGDCCVIECKASRSDFLRDKAKMHHQTETSIIAMRWYLAPPGMIDCSELPDHVGLLGSRGGRVSEVRRAHRVRRPTSSINELVHIVRIARNLAAGAEQPVFVKGVKQ